ncbi:MAG TPA: sigma-70 family RNA polymerase sigma factor, partial [Polyangiaceae bacterium]|nr:sigma-70 family RNA polymerase sigma factor [Polyangiaceae bacterium]
ALEVSGSPLRSEGPGTSDVRIAIEQIYARWKDSVFHIALRYGRGNLGWAEDVTHDVFVEAFRTIGGLVDHEALGGWFYRVTTRRCLNKLKRERWMSLPAVRFLLQRPIESATDPERQAIVRADLARAADAMQALPPTERAVFYMRHLDGKDQTEIAAVLDLSKGYVSKLLKRATKRLSRAGWQVNDGE